MDDDTQVLYNIKSCRWCKNEIVWGHDLNNHYDYFHVATFSVWCLNMNRTAVPHDSLITGGRMS